MTTLSAFRFAAVKFVVGLLFICAYAQIANAQKCPPVTPKNSEEAMMMEAASNKNGCWVRNKDGILVFISSRSPNDNYKPPSEGAGTAARSASKATSGGPAGAWVMDTVEQSTNDIFFQPPRVPVNMVVTKTADGNYTLTGLPYWPGLILAPTGGSFRGNWKDLNGVGEEGSIQLDVYGNTIRYTFRRNVYYDRHPRADWITCVVTGHRKLTAPQ